MTNITIENIAEVLKKIDEPEIVEEKLFTSRLNWLARKFNFSRDPSKDLSVIYRGSVSLTANINENREIISPIDVKNNTHQYNEESILPEYLLDESKKKIAEKYGVSCSKVTKGVPGGHVCYSEFSTQILQNSSPSQLEKKLFSVINARKELDTRLYRYINESVKEFMQNTSPLEE